MRLSEFKGLEGFIFFYFKNNPKEYLKEFQAGFLYMNNLNFFIEKEKKENKKGIGDKYEASQVLTNVEAKFYDYETNEYIGAADAGVTSFKFNEDGLRPIFCLSMISPEDFIVEDKEKIQDDQYKITAIMDMEEEKKKKLLEEFQGEVLVIKAKPFLDRLKESFQEQGYSFKGRKVRYDDYKLNNFERLKSFHDEGVDHLFWKDKSLSYQSEYRVLITNEFNEGPIKPNIGDLSDISFFMSVEELVNKQWKVELYATLEQID